MASLTSAADDLDVGKDAGEIEASGRGLKALLDILYILKSPNQSIVYSTKQPLRIFQ